MAAAHYGAGNLTAIVDCNGLQVDGLLSDVMNVEPLVDKWRAFGWQVLEVDGHDFASLIAAFDRRRAEARSEPWVLLCHTVKGKGVSFMEGVMEWHASPISVELRDKALSELAPFAEPHLSAAALGPARRTEGYGVANTAGSAETVPLLGSTQLSRHDDDPMSAGVLTDESAHGVASRR
jgi:pyruvate dehydrogenase complex dehydrogenase (E1) component